MSSVTNLVVRLIGSSEAVLAAGPGVSGRVASATDRSDTLPITAGGVPVPATDDWPFLYLRAPGIAPYYLAGLAFVLGFALVAVIGAARVSRTPLRRFSPHFFVLGVAFLLLETRSLVTFSLLFGTTWLVNALVFFAILASVLAAIAVNARLHLRSPRLLYAALGASIAVAYLVPAEAFLIEPAALRYGLAAAVAFAPVFFANLVFTYSFRDTPSADMSFASNLLGAMVGGALEYVGATASRRASGTARRCATEAVSAITRTRQTGGPRDVEQSSVSGGDGLISEQRRSTSISHVSGVREQRDRRGPSPRSRTGSRGNSAGTASQRPPSRRSTQRATATSGMRSGTRHALPFHAVWRCWPTPRPCSR